MKAQKYIINEEEIELLERYESQIADLDNLERYDGFPAESLAMFCRLKDKSNDIFLRRIEAAYEVIDLVARAVDLNPQNTGFWLYAPETDGTSKICKRIEEYISRSGEKAQLKKRVQELETENGILRTLIAK